MIPGLPMGNLPGIAAEGEPYTFTTRASAGPITLTGAREGDKVIFVGEEFGGLLFGSFETSISVDDQIQQTASLGVVGATVTLLRQSPTPPSSVAVTAPLTGDGTAADPLVLSTQVTGSNTTTGATSAVVGTVPIATNTGRLVKFSTLAINLANGNYAAWTATVVAINVAGVLTVTPIGTIGAPNSSTGGMSAALLAIAASGTDVVATGTGVAGVTARWGDTVDCALTVAP